MLCSAYCLDLFLCNCPGRGMSSSSSSLFSNGLERLNSLTYIVIFSVFTTFVWRFSVYIVCSWVIISYFNVSFELEFVF